MCNKINKEMKIQNNVYIDHKASGLVQCGEQ